MNDSYLVEKVLKYYQSDWWVVTIFERYPSDRIDQTQILSKLSKLHLFLKKYFDSIFESGQLVLLGNQSYSSSDSMVLNRINTNEPFYYRIVDRSNDSIRDMQMMISSCNGIM